MRCRTFTTARVATRSPKTISAAPAPDLEERDASRLCVVETRLTSRRWSVHGGVQRALLCADGAAEPARWHWPERDWPAQADGARQRWRGAGVIHHQLQCRGRGHGACVERGPQEPGLHVTRLARGVPVGSELEYVGPGHDCARAGRSPLNWQGIWPRLSQVNTPKIIAACADKQGLWALKGLQMNTSLQVARFTVAIGAFWWRRCCPSCAPGSPRAAPGQAARPGGFMTTVTRAAGLHARVTGAPAPTPRRPTALSRCPFSLALSSSRTSWGAADLAGLAGHAVRHAAHVLHHDVCLQRAHSPQRRLGRGVHGECRDLVRGLSLSCGGQVFACHGH